MKDGTADDYMKKLTNLLNTASIVENWIQNFDSHAVNDCFDNRNLNVPKPKPQIIEPSRI